MHVCTAILGSTPNQTLGKVSRVRALGANSRGAESNYGKAVLPLFTQIGEVKLIRFFIKLEEMKATILLKFTLNDISHMFSTEVGSARIGWIYNNDSFRPFVD